MPTYSEDEIEEIIKFINIVIGGIPPFGDFTLDEIAMNGNIEDDFEVVFGTWLSGSNLDNRAYHYLYQEGFAVKRYDLDKNGRIMQLTDRGRKLKDLGSIENYFAGEEGLKKMEERQKARDENLYWIQLWIAVGSVSAAIFYFFQLYDAKPHPYVVIYILSLLVSTLIIKEVLKILKYKRS